MKRRLALFCTVIVVIVACNVPVYARQPQAGPELPETASISIGPQWLNVSYTASDLQPDSVYASVTTYSSTDKVYLSANLQKLSGGSWKSVKAFSANGTWSAVLSTPYSVSSHGSGTYRLQFSASVYDKNGNYIENTGKQYSRSITV